MKVPSSILKSGIVASKVAIILDGGGGGVVASVSTNTVKLY
jgi:hypothetical protein